jgi:transcription factor SPT20
MAAAVTARPVQGVRNRRDGIIRTSTGKGGIAALEKTSGSESAAAIDGQRDSKRRKLAAEPHVRTSAYILNKHKGKPVSMTIHLHQTYFRFDNQEGSWAYDSPMRFVVQHLRQQTIPHGLMEELLDARVPFYDGCLIVEIHNHRQANGKDKARPDSALGDGQTKFSMNNFTNYITPSPFAPYPQAAKSDDIASKSTAMERTKSEQRKGVKEQSGPHISTIVLHPTTLSRHKEIELAARTRVTDLIGPVVEPSTPSNATVSTSRSAPDAADRMVVDAQNMYEFEAKMLLYTEPPLYLEPVRHPEEAQKVLDLLANPLHANIPPSPKVRKRTTAQMAADDAQAAEAERRMLMMDERIKPSVGAGAATSESQGAAASLGISRFKTIQMAKEKIAEQETQKKAEEAQVTAKRRAQEEAHAETVQRQQQQKEEEERRRQTLMQRTADARVQKAAQQALAASQAKQAQVMAQQQQAQMNHALAQSAQNNMLAQQHAAMVAQNSPIVRQQTPMVNSSPMMPQGFPANSASQAAGSPPRPASATIPHPMVRQASQQQIASRHGTPPVPQGTPSMQAQTVANRAVSQTPRGTQASPVPGTPMAPNAAMPNPMAPNRFTPEQMLLMQQQRQNIVNRGNIGPGTPGHEQVSMTPQQIQMVMNRNLQNQQQILMTQANDPSNPQAQAQARAILRQMHQRAAIQNQQRLNAANAQTAGIPAAQQAAQAHAIAQNNQMRQQQQQQLLQGQRELQALVNQFGEVTAIPPQMMTPNARMFFMRTQQQQRSQLLARQAQNAQNTSQPVVGGTPAASPEYMQQLMQQAAMLQQRQQQQQHAAQQQQQQQQQNAANNPMANAQAQNMAAMNMGMMGNLGMNNMQQQQQQQFGQHELSQQFAAMQNALTQQQNRQQSGMQ